MTAISIGDLVPEFQLPATGYKTVKLTDHRGHSVILYFYPKDNTPGCILEGQGFRDRIDEFTAINAVILGVSRDTVRSHEVFKCKQSFPFDLLSDQNENIRYN